MSQLTADHLAELVIDALGRTAFMDAEPAETEQADELPAPARFARIAYSGPSKGQVFLAASEGFVRELAASLLGVEADEIDIEVQGQDALKEMANIIGGLVILHLGGPECRLSLGLPQPAGPADLPSVTDQLQRCCLDSEGERLEVIWAPEDHCSSEAA